jgi:hypothetical protein
LISSFLRSIAFLACAARLSISAARSLCIASRLSATEITGFAQLYVAFVASYLAFASYLALMPCDIRRSIIDAIIQYASERGSASALAVMQDATHRLGLLPPISASSEQDATMLRFIDACILVTRVHPRNKDVLRRRDVYRAYEAFCHLRGESRLMTTQFNHRIQLALGAPLAKSNKLSNFWRGLRLAQPPHPSATDARRDGA